MAEVKKEMHKFFAEVEKSHVPLDNETDGGACLCGHHFPYKETSCSYRWQGLKKASSAPGMSSYNAHTTDAYHIGKRSSRKIAAANVSSYLGDFFHEKTPQGLTVTKKDKKTGKESQVAAQLLSVLNFTNGHTPYANQVHHVVPSGSLRKTILEKAKKFPTLKSVICNGLLEEKYNINHYNNMLILPVQRNDSQLTGLPMHPQNHPDYNDGIDAAINKALTVYDQVAEQIERGEAHGSIEAKSLKQSLEFLSNSMYTTLLNCKKSIRDAKNGFQVNDLDKSAYDDLKKGLEKFWKNGL